MYELEVKEQANRRLQGKNDLNEERITARNARSELLLTLLAVASVLVLVLEPVSGTTTGWCRRLRLKNQVIRRQSGEIHARTWSWNATTSGPESIVSEEQKAPAQGDPSPGEEQPAGREHPPAPAGDACRAAWTRPMSAGGGPRTTSAPWPWSMSTCIALAT